MFYTIYKITNLVNGKIYIGSHKTKNLDDSYMGSGKYLKHAQQKHGIENFRKDILFVFDTSEEMYSKEAELVNEDFIAEENTYNIKVGGFGGFDYVNKNRDYSDPEYRSKISRSVSKAKLGVPHPRTWKTLIKHKESTKQKISLSMQGKQTGSKNSQFGTVWIKHELFRSRKCSLDLYPLYYEQGWGKGR